MTRPTTPGLPTAKFAVKGFTEVLMTDMGGQRAARAVSVVMPGHIGTSILHNSMNFGTLANPRR